jgi:GT2 family glycosyltransferase
MRRGVLDQVGLLDDSYFMYSEEVDLCLRIRRAGWSLYWTPAALVTHYGGESAKLVAERMFLQLYASKVAYFRKHEGQQVAGLYKALLAWASATRLALAPLSLFEQEPKRSRHRQLGSHYWALLGSLRRM